jgi:hypothetical protein
MEKSPEEPSILCIKAFFVDPHLLVADMIRGLPHPPSREGRRGTTSQSRLPGWDWSMTENKFLLKNIGSFYNKVFKYVALCFLFLLGENIFEDPTFSGMLMNN